LHALVSAPTVGYASFRGRDEGDLQQALAHKNSDSSAGGGGSNGSRVRLWKIELQAFATELDIDITVCHLPPGTSKWNRIEHRLFSYITQNWRGRPLVSHQTIVQLIAATTTKAGLTVRSELDTNVYPKGRKVDDAELDAINLHRHDFHGEWNYTIKSQSDAVIC